MNDAQWADVESHRKWLEEAPEEELMKDPVYRRHREWAKNAPKFKWRSYSSECNSEEDHFSNGILTPISLVSQPRDQAASSASHTDTHVTPTHSSSRQQVYKPHASRVVKNQRTKASRRPMTRSHKTNLVALDYEKKGVVIAQTGVKARAVSFAQYMREQV